MCYISGGAGNSPDEVVTFDEDQPLKVVVLTATLPVVALAAPGSELWTRQFGTTNQDIAQGVR
jgi:hypothetical protein